MQYQDWTLEDLTAAGVERVRETGAFIAERLPDAVNVHVLASPMARTLHTARLIVQAIEASGHTGHVERRVEPAVPGEGERSCAGGALTVPCPAARG